ncbi:MAG: polysaccharide biosynthesis tyrosine autokinase [Bacteroidetes bacterium]|nr:polysaccharide biosynthesis tyrosine autokinase [Bacteroidota bacterium]
MDTEFNNSQFQETKSIVDYLQLIRGNLLPILIITAVSFIFALVYAINAVDIYNSTTLVKINKNSGNILESNPLLQPFGSEDRFISNEIEVIKSYTLRERVASALIDSFNNAQKKDTFSVLLTSDKLDQSKKKLMTKEQLAVTLSSLVTVEQKRGLDFVILSASSPSPYEAALIANTYSSEYRNLNLMFNRDQLVVIKNYLDQQRSEKLEALNQAEDMLKTFQESGGIIALDNQASNLISQISTLEASKGMYEIELKSTQNAIESYKAKLAKLDPDALDYLAQYEVKGYFDQLQTEIAKLEIQKLLVVGNDKDPKNAKALKEIDFKINLLKDKLNEKVETFQKSAVANTPEEYKTVALKLMELDIQEKGLNFSIAQVTSQLAQYEGKFGTLPRSAIELAKLTRTREGLEKLYTLIEQRFQEAVINEQSQPGNVVVIEVARVMTSPAKPNRTLIVIIGIVLGLVVSISYVFVRDYFDKTVKTPDQLTKLGFNVLSWIPRIEGIDATKGSSNEFIVFSKPDSIPAEAFRALRTRLQFTTPDAAKMKVILVTSSAPTEGKTIIATNLAGSFSQINKKVLLVDCDLRKPRVHNVFNMNRHPGLVDYLFSHNTLDEIIRTTDMPNLDFIPCGTIPPNPAELMESEAMLHFLNELKDRYDFIILDTPPVIAVTDSEILSRYVDGSILVVSADTTEMELLRRAGEIMRQGKHHFIGAVLNNFVYKSSYGSYYKYYYYYSRSTKTGENS